jgi:FtsP/CotA-like multicopper oxidase with cupredoxin domain
MPRDDQPGPTRRIVIGGLAAATLTGAAEPGLAQSGNAGPPAAIAGPRELVAGPLKTRLRPEPAPEADVWAFDGKLPGPVLRVRHGDEFRVKLVNKTERPLSLHWHGVRNVSAMDGVGGVTQEPVAPGGSFEYRFTPPDAGTFLARPLVVGGSGEPAARGLCALLVVEERTPPPVDQDIALVFRDWLLGPEGALAPFGAPLEAAIAGRLGNTLSVNGVDVPLKLDAARGARLRLRIANAANARATRIRFDGLKVYVAAVDGQPTDTFEPLRASLPFGPGSRYDLLVDLPDEAGATGTIVAMLGAGVPLVTVATAAESASAKRPAFPAIAPIPANKLLPPEIKLQNAARRDVIIAGGAKIGANGQPTYEGDPKRIWTVNGASGSLPLPPPLISVRRGSPVVLAVVNQTAFPQPLHLHGHVFRLLHGMDDGWEPYWLDTLQVPEGKTVRLAFLADNPGKWLISSAVLERFDTGLWTWFEVT